MEYFLPSFHVQFVRVPRSEVGLLKTAYIWILFLYPFSQLCLLVGAFSPFTFKVIIDLYVLIAILLTILDLFLLLFFLLLFSCDLMTIFSVVFEFIFLICLCINCRFLVCSYSEVLIEELYVYEIVLSCYSLNCKCISSVLHLYPPLLMISDFGAIIVHE